MKNQGNFLTWLTEEHDKIMACEHSALERLAVGDTDGYNKLMHEKANMLAAIAKKAEPHLEGLPAQAAARARRAMQDFSASAAMALKLDSVFYMSALLYPDEHKKGDPDNMELFIRDFS